MDAPKPSADDHPADRIPSADHIEANVCEHGTLHITLFTEDDEEIAVACFPVRDVDSLIACIRDAVTRAGGAH